MNRVQRRILSVIPAALVQLLWLFILWRWLAPYATLLNLILSFFAFVYVLHIMANRHEGAYKTLWLLIILGLPVFGTILYFCFGNKRTARPIQKKLKHGRSLLPAQKRSHGALDALREERPRLAQTFHYVEQKTGFQTHACAQAAYYPIGEELFSQMLKDLETAKHSIFAEYFIVESGRMWDSMVEIMARKAAQGVDVRFMYDDLGSLSTYSEQNLKELQAKGIRCIRFNPLVFIKGTLNYRDHRKMLIIDGKIAFSGGINLADEYINVKERFGHWKDVGFRITGAAVENYSRMFAEFWNAFSKEPIPASALAAPAEPQPENGCVLSYYDSPLNRDPVSNNLYMELLAQATEYAWFYTPYLMLGDGLLDALVRAAQRGVDVRVIMPGIPDKKLVFRMSRSYYRPLMEAGVKIYEYTPGFVHAKGCIIDGDIGTVGTVNLDYRSLFLHFENNSLFYRAPLLGDLKRDFEETLEKCVQKTLADTGKGFRKWVVDSVLRIFAPLC